MIRSHASPDNAPRHTSAIFRKLNLTTHDPIVVLDAPDSFDAELALLHGVTVSRALTPDAPLTFALGFAMTCRVRDAHAGAMVAAAEGDAVLWIAYPKQTSQRYRCEFSRDGGWTIFTDAGFEGVRMVAIDADWSALRFRRAQYVKSARRSTTDR